MLQRLLDEFPEAHIGKVNLAEIESVIRSLLRPSTLDKFRSFGFSLLVSYVNLLNRAKIPVKEVWFRLAML